MSKVQVANPQTPELHKPIETKRPQLGPLQSLQVAITKMISNAAEKIQRSSKNKKSPSSFKKAAKKVQRNVENFQSFKKQASAPFVKTRQARKEPNLQKEAIDLFGKAEQAYHKRIHSELDAAETLATTMAQARDVVLLLKAGHKDGDKFDFEEFKKEAAEFDDFLEKAKNEFPDYFSHINSPFGENIKEVDSKQFISNVDTTIEKMHELIAHTQGKIPLCTLKIEEIQKNFMQIIEIMSEGLKQQNRSKSAITHNLRSQ